MDNIFNFRKNKQPQSKPVKMLSNGQKRLDAKPNSNRDTHSSFHVHKNKQTNKPTQLDNDNQLCENNGNLVLIPKPGPGTVSESNQRWETERHHERPKGPDISQWPQKEQQAQAQRLQLAQQTQAQKMQLAQQAQAQRMQLAQQAQAQRLQLAQKQKQATAQDQFERLQRSQQEQQAKTQMVQWTQNAQKGPKGPTQQDHDTNSYKEQIKMLNILIKEKDEKTSQDKNIQNIQKGTKNPTQQDHDINSYKEQIKMLNILVKETNETLAEKDKEIARIETYAELQSDYYVLNKNGIMFYRLVTKEEYENLQQNRRNTNCQKQSTQMDNDVQSCNKEIQTLKNLEKPKSPDTSEDINTQNAQKGPKPPTQRNHDTNPDKEQIKMLKILLKEKEEELGSSTKHNELYREEINMFNIVLKKKNRLLAEKDAEINDTNQVLKKVMEQFNSCKYNVEKLQAKVLRLEQEVDVSKEVISKERKASENKTLVSKLVSQNSDKENATLKNENATLKKEKEILILEKARQETENKELKNQLRIIKENFEETCKLTRFLENEKQESEMADFVQKVPERPNFVQKVIERPKALFEAASNNVRRISSFLLPCY